MDNRLQKFARLVDVGSFTKAADEMHISQPALSTAIAKLERELKAKLVVRGSRPLALTPAGKLAYQTAQELSIKSDNLRMRLKELANEPLELSIGMIDSMADLLFGMGGILELVKDSKISLVVNNSRYLTAAVERGEVDIAFIAAPRGDLPAILDKIAVAPEPLVVVSAQELNPQTNGGVLENFIAYDKPSNTFRLVDESLRGFGVIPRTIFYSTSPEVTLRLVLKNQGVAALPFLLVREHLKSGELKILGGAEPWLIKRDIIALKRRDRDLPKALQQLIDQAAASLSSLKI